MQFVTKKLGLGAPLSRCPNSTLLPFFFWVPLLKPNSRKKGTLIIKGLLGNLVVLHLSLLCFFLLQVLMQKLIFSRWHFGKLLHLPCMVLIEVSIHK